METQGATQTKAKETDYDSVEPLHCNKVLYSRILTYYYNWTGNCLTKLFISFR